MPITLTEATERTGKSKSTLTRAITSGKLSARRSDDGKTYEVDEAELARVYPLVTVNHDSPSDAPSLANSEPAPHTADLTDLHIEIAQLREQLNSKKAHTSLLEDQISDLKQDRDDWKTMASNQSLLLAHEQGQQNQSNFIDRLFRRG